MNAPSEPEGGKKGAGEIRITLLASSGNPWTNGIIEHNGQKYHIGKDGSMKLAVNGGELYANGHTVTRLIKDQISKGVSDIILRHNAWKGIMELSSTK